MCCACVLSKRYRTEFVTVFYREVHEREITHTTSTHALYAIPTIGGGRRDRRLFLKKADLKTSDCVTYIVRYVTQNTIQQYNTFGVRWAPAKLVVSSSPSRFKPSVRPFTVYLHPHRESFCIRVVYNKRARALYYNKRGGRSEKCEKVPDDRPAGRTFRAIMRE